MHIHREIGQASILLIFGVFPPLAGAYLGGSSMALGLFLSFLFLMLVKFVRIKEILKIHKAIFLGLVIFIIYAIVQHMFVGLWDIKSYYSVIALLLAFSLAYFFSKEIVFHNEIRKSTIYYIFWFLIIIAVIAVLTDFRLGRVLYDNDKAIFPFGEVSHFSLFFGPFFLMTVAFSKTNTRKIIYVCLVTVLAFIIPSTTLLIYVLLALGLLIRVSLSTMLIITPILAIIVYNLLTNSYFTSRLIISEESTNLSALVYLQGLQDAYNSLTSTYGIGLGFQMLGTQPLSEAGVQINNLMGGTDLNRKDGGFLAAKLVAELGVFGMCILISFITVFFKAFKKLRSSTFEYSKYPVGLVFSLCFIYASFVEFFVRGVGYFSPTLFLFFVSLFMLYFFSRFQPSNSGY